MGSLYEKKVRYTYPSILSGTSLLLHLGKNMEFDIYVHIWNLFCKKLRKLLVPRLKTISVKVIMLDCLVRLEEKQARLILVKKVSREF